MASKNASGKSYGSGRTRNYATVLYPESAPENWRDILQGFMVPAFISPLHKDDVNADGEPKKPHYHIMLMFENVKTREQAQELFEQIGGVGCEVVNSLRGMSRYLCHLDNPEKAQYPIGEVVGLCGADYSAAIGLPTDKYKCIREMIAWCDENQVESYAELLQYCSVFKEDWFRVLCDSSTLVMSTYLKSRTWTNGQGIVSNKNGENN